MDVFIYHISTFPTVIFTAFLLFVSLYWLVAAIGMADIDVLDVDVDLDADPGSLEGFAGLLFKLGLAGVPLTIVLSIMAMTGWICSYLLMAHLVEPFAPTGLYTVLSLVAGLVAFFASLRLSSLFIKPLKPLFKAANGATKKDLIGQTAIVRSSKVSERFGEARLSYDGASHLIKIRAEENNQIQRGDKVVLIEYQPEARAYFVITEREFKHS